MRIDHFLFNPSLAPRLLDAQVDREVSGWQKTRVNAPVWIEIGKKAQGQVP